MKEGGRVAFPAGRTGRALLLAAVLLLWALLVRRFWFVCDDAFISFRYARHLVEGLGLRFNAGESPPVEGYSNLLWVLWISLLRRAGVDPSAGACATSVACGAALLLLATRAIAARVSPLPRTAIAGTLFLACLPPMSLWSTGGLETMPFALAVFAAWERLSAPPSRARGAQAGICALAAALLRADGLAWVAFAFAAAAVAQPAASRRERLRAWAPALAVPLAGAAIHLLARHAYYGEWLPNTARVKAGFSAMRLERGLRYVVAFGLEVLPFLIVPAGAVLFRPGRRARVGIACLLFLALAAAYSIFVGGDFMPMGRFLVPAMPFLALLLASLVAELRSAAGALALAGSCSVLALLPAFDLHAVPLALRERLHFRWNQETFESEVAMWRGMRDRAGQWILLGRALAANTSPGESIILGNLGAVGYETELEILDPFGLVDPEVARREAPLVRASPGHDKRVPFEFFFPRHPTYLTAWLAGASSAPDASLPAEWLALLRAGTVELLRRPLRAEDGFPPGTELRLLRFRRAG